MRAPGAALSLCRDWASATLDLVFPRRCAACRNPVGREGRHLCGDCLSAFQWVRFPYCGICGDPVDGAVDQQFVCSMCRAARPHFDLARSAARFREGLKDALHTFKYGQGTWLSRDLGIILRACVEAHFRPAEYDAFAYVPLFHTKERERTHNQSRLLADELSALLGKPVMHQLERSRMTPSQTHLTIRERALNVKGAFRVRNPRWIEGRGVLLVDDVMTTGATVNEVSRVLKDAGATRVYVVTVARG